MRLCQKPMITQTRYKNRFGVRVESRRLSAVFLPEDGGKMASLTDCELEYLVQNPSPDYGVLTPTGSYIDSECSGFDDMFPTVDPYVPASGRYQGVLYPDHGEVCRIPHSFEIMKDRLVLTARSELFALIYRKEVRANEKGGITLCYTIENEADEPFTGLWAGHCMLAGSEHGLVVSAYPEGKKAKWMFCPDKSKVMTDFIPTCDEKQLKERGGPSYKYYYLDQIEEGYCGYYLHDRSRGIAMRYDHKKLPYLGVWMNNGEFKGMYNIALEPASTPFDSPIAGNAAHGIAPRGKFEFSIELEVMMSL